MQESNNLPQGFYVPKRFKEIPITEANRIVRRNAVRVFSILFVLLGGLGILVSHLAKLF